MSPVSTSPSPGGIPVSALSSQPTHGIDQLAQASLQSARLGTQTPLYPVNYVEGNEVNSNGMTYPIGLTPPDTSSTLITAVNNHGAAHIKQEKDNLSSNSQR